MNYLWEIMLAAKEQGISEDEINFKVARKYSPYMELSEEFLNKVKLEEPYTVEINPYYRFQPIFQYMFHPDLEDDPSLRSGLFQLLMHQLAENDLKMGMTREEYYKKLLGEAISGQVYGREATDAFTLFTGKERETLLEGMLMLYRTGESLTLFRHVMCALISDCIVYNSNEDPFQILIYIGKKKTEELERKNEFIIKQFLGIQYQADLYYEYHFGIIGIGETMEVGEIAIC
ncbi:MAG: hypothetical protein K2H52_16375 [Lachnospiraceae bacterium]|nr:hypothetical protein [Lachnospiraceae bacterium]